MQNYAIYPWPVCFFASLIIVKIVCSLKLQIKSNANIVLASFKSSLAVFLSSGLIAGNKISILAILNYCKLNLHYRIYLKKKKDAIAFVELVLINVAKRAKSELFLDGFKTTRHKKTPVKGLLYCAVKLI